MENAMKETILFLILFLVSTVVVSSENEECQCITAECAAGLRPAIPHAVSYEEACMLGGTMVCGIASFKLPAVKRKVFLLQCNTGKTTACVTLCK